MGHDLFRAVGLGSITEYYNMKILYLLHPWKVRIHIAHNKRSSLEIFYEWNVMDVFRCQWFFPRFTTFVMDTSF